MDRIEAHQNDSIFNITDFGSKTIKKGQRPSGGHCPF
jgi:hypothetical protein